MAVYAPDDSWSIGKIVLFLFVIMVVFNHMVRIGSVQGGQFLDTGGVPTNAGGAAFRGVNELRMSVGRNIKLGADSCPMSVRPYCSTAADVFNLAQ